MSIKFSKRKARENWAYENKLIENTTAIEKSIDSNDHPANRQTLQDYLESKQVELEAWRDNKLSVAMIRSSASINSQWE